jgi:hypothetical protein
MKGKLLQISISLWPFFFLISFEVFVSYFFGFWVFSISSLGIHSFLRLAGLVQSNERKIKITSRSPTVGFCMFLRFDPSERLSSLLSLRGHSIRLFLICAHRSAISLLFLGNIFFEILWRLFRKSWGSVWSSPWLKNEATVESIYPVCDFLSFLFLSKPSDADLSSRFGFGTHHLHLLLLLLSFLLLGAQLKLRIFFFILFWSFRPVY